MFKEIKRIFTSQKVTYLAVRMKSMLMWIGTTSDSVLYGQITCLPPEVPEKETSNKVALAVTATSSSTLLLEFSTTARQKLQNTSQKLTIIHHIISKFSGGFCRD